jgi:hypothetical protein
MTDHTQIDSAAPAEIDRVRADIEASVKLANRAKSGASWLYLLAALSVINSIIALSGGTWTFIFGLGITQAIDGGALYLSERAGSGTMGPKVFGLMMDLAIACVWVYLGVQARNRRRWAFIVGMVFYVIDAILVLVLKDFFGFLFHIWVFLGLRSGYVANQQLIMQQAAHGAGAADAETTNPT